MDKHSVKGILTLAQGKQRYVDMAVNLAKSIRLNCPGVPIAIVTDRPELEMKSFFDHVIPVNPDYGLGLIQKIHLYEYSPFEKTIFIDADCLVVRNFSFLWDLFEGQDVSVIGNKLTTGTWAGMGVETVIQQIKAPYIIQLNGGIYYFRKGVKAASVYQKAQELLDRYDELGIAKLRGQVNEEPLMSLAMSIYRQDPVDDGGKGMRTPVGQSGVFTMDILKGTCAFYKHGICVEPAIMHFGGGYPEAFHYRREIKKLNRYFLLKLPKPIVSFSVNVGWNFVYFIYVLFYRITKSVVKRKKMQFTPLLPMFRFE